MADEEKQKAEQVTGETTGEKTGQKSDQERITELEGLVAGKAEELTRAAARVTELETAVVEANDRAGKLDGSLKQAVMGYKTLMTKANPDVLPEMLSGESIEALDGSLAKARELIGKIKTGLETQSKATRVPAGAPQRGAVDVSGMTPREKIAWGMEHAKK